MTFKDSMILKELGGYKMSFLRTNKKWKKLGVAVYDTNASVCVWGGGRNKRIQIQEQPGLHSETQSQNRESKRRKGKRVTEGKKDFFFLVDRNFPKYIGCHFNPETEIHT